MKKIHLLGVDLIQLYFATRPCTELLFGVRPYTPLFLSDWRQQ
ncbi:hypothetical protein [uncultured Fibrella sp.]